MVATFDSEGQSIMVRWRVEGNGPRQKEKENVHQESVMFAFFVLFVLLLLFSGEKSKIQKSTDYFSKANPSTFSILFSCFLIFFSTFLSHLQK